MYNCDTTAHTHTHTHTHTYRVLCQQYKDHTIYYHINILRATDQSFHEQKFFSVHVHQEYLNFAHPPQFDFYRQMLKYEIYG